MLHYRDLGVIFALVIGLSHGEIIASSFTFLPVLAFEIPPIGAPGEREDAASRPPCLSEEIVGPGLTALIPGRNIGFTQLERPTFWFYVPFSDAKPIEFILQERDENSDYQVVYRVEVDFPGSPGLVGARLPNRVSLQEGHRYRWIFSYLCNATGQQDFVVNGRVDRVTPDWEYIEDGLWYEKLQAAIDRYRDFEDVGALQELLAVVGLEQVSEELGDNPVVLEISGED